MHQQNAAIFADGSEERMIYALSCAIRFLLELDVRALLSILVICT